MPNAAEKTGTCRIVVADDAAVFRQRFIYSLANLAEAEVVGEAENGEEALRLCGTLKPDLLLLDIMMPELNGLEVLEELEHFSAPPVAVVMTNYPSPFFKRKCLELGAVAFFEKGLDQERIRTFIDEFRQRKEMPSITA